MISADLKQELIRKYPRCACGCGRPSEDLHHGLIHRMKRYSEWLDDERNLIPVSHEEHIARMFDTWEWRRKFWRLQVRRYGYLNMCSWITKLPAKLKSRIDFVELIIGKE